MKKVLFLLILSISTLLAENNTTTTQNSDSIIKKSIIIKNQNEKLIDINKELNSDVWFTKYTNHQLYLKFKKELEELEKKRVSKKQKEEKKQKIVNIKNKMHLLEEFKDSPFSEILNPTIKEKSPKINSPFDMVKAFSYLKILKSSIEENKVKLKDLNKLLIKLNQKRAILEKLHSIEPSQKLEQEINKIKKEIKDIQNSYSQAKMTSKLFEKKVGDDKLKITKDIKVQINKLINVAIMIFVTIFLSFIFKLIVGKTITDNQRHYMANKFINFTNLIVILLILLFSFLENVSYLVTVIGFASAGIAIAMKDLFMSLLGWTVIVFGGSFHVGDRIKVTREGQSFVGDIVDISFLRMTILEDITYTTLMENHRAGRIIFIPNNYVFTDVLANYTHEKIKTVWDEIDIVITFDSNFEKATRLVKEIVKKYSKGYTDISRKQLNMLRNQYSLKNINVEPRVYTFLEPYGIKIATWYMTNSYATLTLRSSISANIIQAIKEHDDIQIAYPTEVINIKRDKNIPIYPPKEDSEESIS